MYSYRWETFPNTIKVEGVNSRFLTILDSGGRNFKLKVTGEISSMSDERKIGLKVESSSLEKWARIIYVRFPVYSD